MYSLTSSLPQHLYGHVRREFITNGTDTGIDKCIIHAVSVRPAQALTFSILLENGAQYRGVPIHGLVVGQDSTMTHPPQLDLHSHQVWGCFGTEFSIINMTFSKGLSAEWVDSFGNKLVGRGLGWAIEFHDDGYSNAPQQDKSFNMLVSQEGYLAAMPNNRVRWWEDSFTNWKLPIKLKVNHKTYYVEKIGNNPEETAFVKE
jgi:hypothetical protein